MEQDEPHESDAMARFEKTLERVLTVSKDELDEALAAEKRKREREKPEPDER